MARPRRPGSKPRSAPKARPASGPASQASDALSVEQALVAAYGHWTAGQAEPAERLCRRVLAAWPGQGDALHLLGLIAHAHGNLDAAIEFLREACRAPRVAPLHLSNLAEMCRQRGLLEEGERAARQAVALDGSLAAAWNNLGILLQERGKLEESLAALQRVVQLAADFPEGHNNLANTLRRLGRLRQAGEHYQRALALRPGYVEALGNRAGLALALGRTDEALALARQALELDPQFPAAYLHAAAAEAARGRHAEALIRLDALLAFAPLHPAALVARAEALRALGAGAEALEVARQATAAGGGAAARVCLAACLADLGRGEDALDALAVTSGAEGDGGEESILTARARLLLELGRLEDCAALLDEIQARWPRHPDAWTLRSVIKRFAPGDPDIERLETLLEPGGAEALQDRVALHFALGKAWTDAGNPRRAFRHLEQGNALKRAHLSYDREAAGRRLAEIAAAFPARRFETPGGGPGCDQTGSDLPVFVVGMPRSGTTLVDQILAAHPDVESAGELKALERAAQRHGALPGLTDDPQTRLDGVLSEAQAAAIGRAYLAALAPFARGAARVVDKMPLNFLHLGLIALALPGARIVHCRRDPLDTCFSCFGTNFAEWQPFACDLRDLGGFHRDYERLMDHWRAVLPAGRLLEVDYEALVADPEAEARRLVAFCGLPWDPVCLAPHLGRRPVRTASAWQVRQPIAADRIGRWKPFEPWLGPLVEALGDAEGAR